MPIERVDSHQKFVTKLSSKETYTGSHLSLARSSGFGEGTLRRASRLGRQLSSARSSRLTDYSSSSGSNSKYSHEVIWPANEPRHHQKHVRLLQPESLSSTDHHTGSWQHHYDPNPTRLSATFQRAKLDRNLNFPPEADSQSDSYALSELFSQSEIPGFREIFASDSYFRKFCWLVAFLFMTVLSLNDLTELITEYYEYPITVNVRLRDAAKLPFLAVTVCNLNAVRYSALCANSHSELTSKMPTEMRDKLCGVQVEKRKQQNVNSTQTTSAPSDSEVVDINNIGITSTTASSFITQQPNAMTSTLQVPLATVVNDEDDLAQKTQLDAPLVRLLKNGNVVPAAKSHLSKVRQSHFFNPRLFAPLNRHLKVSPVERESSGQRAKGSQYNGLGLAADKLGPKTTRTPSLGNSVSVANQEKPVGKLNSDNNNQQHQQNTTTQSPIEDFELTERQERELQENLTNWLAVMYQREPILTSSLGHQFDDMILRCTMKSINCTRQSSFQNSFSPTEGNCFTFKSRVKRRIAAQQMTIHWDTFEEANLAGTSDGLELVLNLETGEYISGSSQVGALVMIHHPNDLGFAASEATFVAPEFTTYIGLKMVNISRLPAPYPEACVDSWPAKFADKLTQNSTYSQQACLKICLQKTIQAKCNCQSAFLPIVELTSQLQQHREGATESSRKTLAPTTSFVALEPSEVLSASAQAKYPQDRSISIIDKHKLKQLSRLSVQNDLSLKTSLHLNEAPSSLNDMVNTSVNYEQLLSQTGKLSQPRIIICDTRKKAIRQCVRDVNSRAADRVQGCECPAKCGVIRYDKTISMARWPTREDKVTFDRGKLDVNFQNLAKVIVYFQSMTCEETQQQPVFNAAQLFSSLGGIMGMYVGFSFLSVFEIIEVMSRKFWHHLTNRFRNYRPR